MVTRTLRIGLTGGIATGKSRVAALLEASGVPVIRADEVGHEVLARDPEVRRGLVARFGPGVLGIDGAPDRRALGALVFRDPEARRALEAMVQPLIRREVERRLADAEARGIPLVAVEAALILEADWRSAFHRLVVVTCSPELQLRRLMDRDGLDRASAEARLRAQLPVADKVAAGDHVVCNDGDPEALASQVADLLSSLRKDRDDHQQGNP